jgi:hypothetical protein
MVCILCGFVIKFIYYQVAATFITVYVTSTVTSYSNQYLESAGPFTFHPQISFFVNN